MLVLSPRRELQSRPHDRTNDRMQTSVPYLPPVAFLFHGSRHFLDNVSNHTSVAFWIDTESQTGASRQ